MAYWGAGPSDNDFAFGAVGAYVFMIKERLFNDADLVIKKAHPEQGIVASLRCLRLIAAEFPKCVRVHFGKNGLAKARAAFGEWFNCVEAQLPAEYRDAIRSHAEAEFELFETQVLSAS